MIGFKVCSKLRRIPFFVGDAKKFIDMLFYNIQKHRYVLIEVKTRALIPEIWDN